MNPPASLLPFHSNRAGSTSEAPGDDQLNDLTILQTFLKETLNSNPTSYDVEKYLAFHRISTYTGQQLREWQVQQENGEIETEYCPTCWSIAVIKPGSYEDGIAFNTCENCYRTVCEFCHQHDHGREPCRCLCVDCAKQSRFDAAIPA